jgi:hypothetical protein
MKTAMWVWTADLTERVAVGMAGRAAMAEMGNEVIQFLMDATLKDHRGGATEVDEVGIIQDPAAAEGTVMVTVTEMGAAILARPMILTHSMKFRRSDRHPSSHYRAPRPTRLGRDAATATLARVLPAEIMSTNRQ